METFDFDRQFRLMELAGSDAEFLQLKQELDTYLHSSPEHKEARHAAWKQAIHRLCDRSEIELATFRELMGQPVSV